MFLEGQVSIEVESQVSPVCLEFEAPIAKRSSSEFELLCTLEK